MAYWMIEDETKAAAGGGGILPPVGKVVQAAAFGAILGGATTGAVNAMRVKSGEIDRNQAVQETVQVAARGAASMAIASVAAHVVRVYPLFGVLTLVAVGAAVLSMRQQKKPARQERPKPSPRAAAAPAAAMPRATAKKKPASAKAAPRRGRKPAGPTPASET